MAMSKTIVKAIVNIFELQDILENSEISRGRHYVMSLNEQNVHVKTYSTQFDEQLAKKLQLQLILRG